MGFVFDFAELIYMGIGLSGDESVAFIKDKLRNHADQKRLIKALTLAIENDPELPRGDKMELKYIVNDKKFVAVFLAAATGPNAEPLETQSESEKKTEEAQIIERWNSVFNALDTDVQDRIQERILKAAVKAIVKTLPLDDQLLHHKLDRIQMQLEQVRQSEQQDEAKRAIIDELEQQQRQHFDILRAMLENLVEEVTSLGLGSLSVDDRVNAYLPNMLNSLTQNLCEGREEEIQEINEFIHNNEDGYQWWWWRAEAWAGKTTLMAHLAKNPEPGVSVAAAFIVGLELANSDSDAFYAHLIPQLAKIAGLSRVEIPTDLQGRDAQLKRMISIAAAKVRLNGGRLLILVDGLDEDQGRYSVNGIKKQSIIASLPELLPSNVRVIVSSRPNPPLPIDVPDTHPLQNRKFWHPLRKSEFAKAAEKVAREELKEIFGREYGRKILAFMAASGGWLTARDLAELTGQEINDIENTLIDGATARSFRTMQIADEESAYSIGHDLLDQMFVCGHLEKRIRPPRSQGIHADIEADRDRYEQERAEIEADRGRYQQERFDALKEWRRKIAVWAEKYTKQKLTEPTPDYFCSEALANLLSGDPDLEDKAVAILTNQSRISLLYAKHGNDYQSITQLQSFVDILAMRIKKIPSKSLTHLATALHFLSELSERTRNIPTKLPAVFALLGKSDYAVELALSIVEPREQANALDAIADALAKSGKVTEASKAANLALSSAKTITDPYDKSIALADIADALAKSGKVAEASKAAKLALSIAKTITDPKSKSRTLAYIADALAKSGKVTEASKAANLALSTANTITGPDYKTLVLADIAAALAKSGNITKAIEIANDITNPDYKTLVLADIAAALTKSGNTAKAFDIAELALRTANTIPELKSRALTLGKIAIKLSSPELHDLQVKATVAMLIAAKSPWENFDVLLKVAEPTALAILPLLL